MADNEDLVNVLDSLRTALDNQRMDSRTARRADKAILAEIKKKNRYDSKEGRNRALGVGKRALKATGRGALAGAGAIGKAAGGFVGREIGGIPIAGAIFRILGKKFANASLERKQYKKTLVIRRKLEIKEMARMEKIKAKLEAKREETAAKDEAKRLADAEREANGEGPAPKGGRNAGMSAAVEKLTEAAMHMQATAISMTPAIQTFHETVERMSEVVEAMQDNKQNEHNKVRDAQLLSYLHGIDYLTQENAVIAENSFEETKTIGKNISNIKWHTARQSNTVNRIEKLMQEKEKGGDNMVLELMAKDVSKIYWHIARINGSSSRTEKLMVQAAADRIKELNNQQTQIKMQKKQLDAAEESAGFAAITAVGSIAGAATSAIGGLGSMVAAGGSALLAGGAAVGGAALAGGTAIGGAVIAALPEILAAGAVIAAIGGVAYAVYKMLPSSWFGDDKKDPSLDPGVYDPSAGPMEFNTTGEAPRADGKLNPLVRDAPVMAPTEIDGKYNPISRPVPISSPDSEGDGGLTSKSAEIEDSKSGGGYSGAGASINAPSTSIQNQTTVQPGVMSASPYETQARQRQLA